jgi:flagellar protein FlaG
MREDVGVGGAQRRLHMNSVDSVGSASQPLAMALATQVSPEQKAENREIIQAVKAVNNAELFGNNSELTFSLDRQTRRAIVRIMDRKTNEVIQQIPPEYVLRLAEDLKSQNSTTGR